MLAARRLMINALTPWFIDDGYARANSTTSIGTATDPAAAFDSGVYTIMGAGATYGIDTNRGYQVNSSGGNDFYVVRRNLRTASCDFNINMERLSTTGWFAMVFAYDPVTATGYRLIWDGTFVNGQLEYLPGIGALVDPSTGPDITTGFANEPGLTQNFRILHDAVARTVDIWMNGVQVLTARDLSDTCYTGTWVGWGSNRTANDYVDLWQVAQGTDPVVGPGVFVAGAGNGASSNSASVSIPGSRAAGDLMVFAVNVTNPNTVITTPPSGWTLQGRDTRLAVYSKISDGTETNVTAGLAASVGWSAAVQILRGTNIRVAGGAFGPSATTSTTCSTPTVAVNGDPLALHIWAGNKTFSGSVTINPPGSTSNVTHGTQPGRHVAMASENLSGVTTTTARTATATATVDDGWGAAVLTVAIDT